MPKISTHTFTYAEGKDYQKSGAVGGRSIYYKLLEK